MSIQNSPWKPTQVTWDGEEVHQVRYRHEDGGEAIVYQTGKFALPGNPAFNSFSRAEEILRELGERAAYDFCQSRSQLGIQHTEVTNP
jgi:hypothetical protein